MIVTDLCSSVHRLRFKGEAPADLRRVGARVSSPVQDSFGVSVSFPGGGIVDEIQGTKIGGSEWLTTVTIKTFPPIEVVSPKEAPKRAAKPKLVLPPGIRFAPGGRQALRLAVASLTEPDNWRVRFEFGAARPAIIVLGPPLAGKTSLVRALVERAFPGSGPLASTCAFRASDAVRMFGLASEMPYLFFDDFAGPVTRLVSPSLLSFLTSSHWAIRPLHSQRIEARELKTRVFLAGPEDLCIPDELARRAIIIRLKESEVSA